MEECEVRIELIEQEPVNISLVSCENAGITFSILPWVNSHNYSTGDQVQYGGAAYIALRPTVGDNPLTSPLDWELYIGGSGGGGGGGTVTNFVFTNGNGITGTVATSTTVPTLSLTLGAITPSSVVASGSITGSNLSGTNTGDQDLSPYALISSLTDYFNKSVDDTDDIVQGSTNLFFTDERAQDAVGSSLLDSTTIDFTYNDGSNQITAIARTQMSITSDASGLKLSGDASTPGNNYHYGTNGSGVKGWYADISLTGYATEAYADAKVADVITNGVLTVAPSQNAVFDALALKENSITPGTTAQYWRGDKSWQTLNSTAVGLGNVDNTSDANKPVSTAQATAIGLKVSKAGDTMTGALLMGLGGTTPISIANPAINASNTANGVVQLNIQNQSNGTSASSDLVATADTGTDSINYVDLGINSSTYSDAGYNIGGPLDAYLYSNGGNLSIGTQSTKDLVFHTDGTTSSKERMRITAAGGVTIQAPGNVTKSVMTVDAAQTVTNKRRQMRVYSTTSTATLTPEIDTYDYFMITAQAAAINIANHSTSVPTVGEKIQIVITDNGTARAITFGTNYVAKGGIVLPTTTILDKRMELGFEWDANLGKWVLLAFSQEA